MPSDALDKLNRALSGTNGGANGEARKADQKSGATDPRAFFKEGERTAAKPADEIERNPDGSAKFNKDGSERKKRGRKPGQQQQPRRQTPAQQDGAIETIATALAGIHWVAASALNAPEFAMKEDQAEKVAKSVDRVMRAYQVPRNEKVESVAELASVLGAFYVTSAMKYNTRKKLEVVEARKRAAAGTTAKAPDKQREQAEGQIIRPAFGVDPTPGKIQ